MGRSLIWILRTSYLLGPGCSGYRKLRFLYQGSFIISQGKYAKDRRALGKSTPHCASHSGIRNLVFIGMLFALLGDKTAFIVTKILHFDTAAFLSVTHSLTGKTKRTKKGQKRTGNVSSYFWVISRNAIQNIVKFWKKKNKIDWMRRVVRVNALREKHGISIVSGRLHIWVFLAFYLLFNVFWTPRSESGRWLKMKFAFSGIALSDDYYLTMCNYLLCTFVVFTAVQSIKP